MSASETDPTVPVPAHVSAPGRFTFELTDRVALGSPDDFLAWINRKFDTHIPDVNALSAQAPEPLKELVLSLLRMKITIDALVIETGPEARWRFAASVDFTAAPPRVGSFLELDRVGFRVTKGEPTAGAAPPLTTTG